jgi:Alpha-kinase family
MSLQTPLFMYYYVIYNKNSHFSYECSKKEELVVDIQGSGFEFTDPQLHSKDKQFGRADRGESGFQDFFRTHKCNYICQELGLKDRSH